jgi:hypothetical protein
MMFGSSSAQELLLLHSLLSFMTSVIPSEAENQTQPKSYQSFYFYWLSQDAESQLSAYSHLPRHISSSSAKSNLTRFGFESDDRL